MVTEAEVQDAVRAREKYFRNESQQLTMKRARRVLEDDLRVQTNTLDDPNLKATVKSCIDNLLSTENLHEHKRKRKASSTAQQVHTQDQKQARKASAKSVKSTSATQPKSQHVSRRLQRLKESLRTAGIVVPPVVYKKAAGDEGKLCEMLKQMLEDEGLSEKSKREELKQVKDRKDTEKDLEGIDTANIVSDSRSQRTTRGALRSMHVNVQPSQQQHRGGTHAENGTTGANHKRLKNMQHAEPIGTTDSLDKQEGAYEADEEGSNASDCDDDEEDDPDEDGDDEDFEAEADQVDEAIQEHRGDGAMHADACESAQQDVGFASAQGDDRRALVAWTGPSEDEDDEQGCNSADDGTAPFEIEDDASQPE